MTGNVTAKIASCGPTQAIGLYDDGGSFGVNCVDSFTGTTANNNGGQPATPAADQGTYFLFSVDSGFPSMPAIVDNATGLMTPIGVMGAFQNFGTLSNWDVGCVRSQGWSINTLIYQGANSPVATAGSVGSDAWSSASFLGRNKGTFYGQVVSSVNTNVGIKYVAGQQSFWRGNAAGAGGFLLWLRASIRGAAFHQRWAFGAFNTTSLLVNTADPDTATDSVYIGCNTTDTNLGVCSNDNVGLATCSTLGGNFPCNTSGAFYDFWFYSPPNGDHISYAIQRLDTPANAAGSITSDLPRNTVQMNWQMWGNSGDAGSTISVGFFGACYAENL